METNRTELVFILDRSGSMSGLEADTIGGYNGLLAKQKEVPGEAWVTTVLFDDRYELLYDRVPLMAVEPITEKEYYVRGCTALLDAMGRTIARVAARQKSLPPECRADHVLFVITTDGMENASREYSYAAVQRLVSQQQECSGWEFLFLGANIDAIATARRYGIRPSRAVNYCPDPAGTRLNYETLCDAASSVRLGAALDENWKEPIARDFERRGRPHRK